MWGNGKLVEVEVIGHFRLLLHTGYYLDFIDTIIVSSFRWNLVFVSQLDKFGHSCLSRNKLFSLSTNANAIGTSFLNIYDNIYTLDIVESYIESMHTKLGGIRHKINKEYSTI